jgi:hypothetical protein
VLIRQGERQAAVFFCRNEKMQQAFFAALPGSPRTLLVIADLEPGQYIVTTSGGSPLNLSVANDGLAIVPQAVGEVKITRR